MILRTVFGIGPSLAVGTDYLCKICEPLGNPNIALVERKMARVHKGKAVTKPQVSAKPLKKQPKNGISKTQAQVLALGGTKEDIDLLSNVDEASTSEPSFIDV